MVTSRLSTGATRRRVAGAAAILGAAGALTVGPAPAGNAADERAADPKARVTVKITQNGDYTAALCAADALEGRCVDGVRRGQTRTFTVNPGSVNDQVEIRVVVRGGGSEFRFFPAGDARELSFVTAGSANDPVIRQVR